MTSNETSPDQAVEAVALLRCPNPWCGENQPVLIVWGSARKWRVQCDCGIYPGDSDTEAEAVALWNDRAAIPTPPPADQTDRIARGEAKLKAWVEYDPPAITRESSRLRHAYFSGWEAADALQAHASPRELEPELANGHRRQWMHCKIHDRYGHYDYVPYSLSTAIMIMPCGCSTRECDAVSSAEARTALDLG